MVGMLWFVQNDYNGPCPMRQVAYRRFSIVKSAALCTTLASCFNAVSQTPVECSLYLDPNNAGRPEVRWFGGANRFYHILSALRLGESWQTINTNVVLSYVVSEPMRYDGGAPEAQRFYRVIEMDFVWIAPGKFTMGSPDTEEGRSLYEGPQIDMTITEGFWIGKHEVTQMEFRSVMNFNPSFFNGVKAVHSPNPDTDFGVDLNRPVETVNWEEATNYCHILTMTEELAGRVPSGFVYRLPTEAEWEFACRAGTTTRFSFGDSLSYSELSQYAWFPSDERTHPVGEKLPSPLGLYDIHGSVYEWCVDRFIPYYGGAETNRVILIHSETARVTRGGGFGQDGSDYRSAFRNPALPSARSFSLGFRVVLARPL